MKRKQSLLLSVMLFCLTGTSLAEAANYTVKAGGGGNFTAIQACADAAVAGDTCTVFAGRYPEYVSLPTSGRAGDPITFQVNPGDLVVMRGFTITGQSYITIGGGTTATGFDITEPTFSKNACIYLQTTKHVIIQNNYIHECGINQGIRLTQRYPSSYTSIRGNTIAWPNAHPAPPCTTGCGHGAAGILVNGDHTLVDGNDISHVTDFISNYGSFNVIRNNAFHDVRVADFPSTTDTLHVDGIESSCSSLVSAMIHNLYEGNTETNNLTPNAHAFLFADSTCGSHGVIMRENAILNLGSIYLLDAIGGVPGVKDYNNTVDHSFALYAQCQLATFVLNAVQGSLINDIFYNASKNNCGWYATDPTTSSSFVGKHDLGYLSSCGTGCTYLAPFGTDPGNIKNRDPLFVDPTANLHLQVGSPARGAGTWLTTVARTDTGWGTSLVVNDAGFFQDGAGIVNADWIRVGATNTVQISSVNYTTNTINLANGISRSVGDPVYLYKDSNGKVVLLGSNPDMGAYQYGPAPARNLTAVAH